MKSALLTLIAIVASLEGDRANVEGDLLRYLHVGDRGTVFYELTVAREERTIDVGTAQVLSLDGTAGEVRIDSDRQILPGFGIRFEVPFERVETDLAEHPREPRTLPDELEAAVRAWAGAWSAQDVLRYLDAYSADFSPPRGLGLEAWKAERHQRLTTPEYIRVEIEELEVSTATPTVAEVAFRQSYSSNTFSDRVIKTLTLVLEEGRWKIAREESNGP